MRGASAESLETLTEDLGSAVEGGADAARIADDLFGAAQLLTHEPSLRRVVTDQSVTGEAKSGLVRQLFGEQFGAESLDLVAKAASLRWAGTRDLGHALERLGVIAVVKGADKAGHADALEDELFGFGRMVVENPELRDALSDPARSMQDKRALLRGLLEGRATAATIRLAEQSVAGMHRTVSVAIDEYQKVAAENRHRLVATVRVARELADGDKQRLEGTLADQYGRPVHLNVVVDPAVIGGMKVEIGDDVIDGTIASRLDEARRRLAG
ncbi:MAG TPA: F0F1 ATP synthase subunit delta [Nocardioidaceae bacterium]|nr:F0F1 ATP synthase subunit delta [Nocardioidaceae bacterium]